MKGLPTLIVIRYLNYFSSRFGFDSAGVQSTSIVIAFHFQLTLSSFHLPGSVFPPQVPIEKIVEVPVDRIIERVIEVPVTKVVEKVIEVWIAGRYK